MKKLLVILFVLILLAAGGIAVFIATFDADRYRPLVVEQLEKSLGRPVALQHIRLAWRNGIAAEFHGLSIAGDSAAALPLLELESASALVRLTPLLRKQVEIVSVELMRPSVHVARDAQGKINLLGLAAVASPASAAAQPTGKDRPPVSFNIGSVRLSQGIIHWTDALAQPVAELTLKAVDVTVRNIAPQRPMDIAVKAAIGGEGQNVQFTGKVLPPSGDQPGFVREGNLDIQEVPLVLFLPKPPPGSPEPEANLTTRLSLEAPALSGVQALWQSSGQGTVKLTEVKVRNLNILRAVFDKFSMLPGLTQRLESRLPAEYQDKLNATDTAFAPITLPVKLENGSLLLDEVVLQSDTGSLSGQGKIGLIDQSVVLSSTLRIEPQLSEAIIRSVEELHALANAQGEIEVPLLIQGRIPKVVALPDVRYLASKVIINKVFDLIQNRLAPNETPNNEQPQAPTTEELLGNLLQRAIRKNLPQESSQPSGQ